MKFASAVEKTGNDKLGKHLVSATSVSQESCPKDCALYHSGCYAEYGPQGMFVTGKLNKAAKAENADAMDCARAEAVEIGKLSGKLPLRLHVVGDCATSEAARIVSDAASKHTAKHGKTVWTYTHAWKVVARENWQNVSVLASCDNPDDIEAARTAGYATAVMVDQFESKTAYKLDNGQKVIPCPEMTGKAANCASCQLCMKDSFLRENNLTIAFELHGTGIKKATAALAAVKLISIAV